ncbi:MAG: hypothetical protein AB3N64_08760 [Puniceicoccaceae bacterium]
MDTLLLIGLVVSGYFGITILIGILFSRHIKSSGDYYKGGSVIPWWAAGLSQYMAGFSSYSFVVVAGVIYAKGAFGVLWALIGPVSILIGARLFSHLWHRSGITTPIEFLEERFSGGMKQFFAWMGILSRPLSNGVRLAAFGILISALLGFGMSDILNGSIPVPVMVVVIGGLVVCAYTLLGGLFGAVVTDVLQFIILQTALIPLFVLCYIEVGGIGGFIAQTPSGFLAMPGLESTEWLWLFAWCVIFFCDYNAGQWGLITRYICTKSERDARKVGLLAGILYLPMTILVMFPILVARMLNPEIHPESSFGWIIQEVFPPGMVAIMLAAMFAATLSTISAELNTLSGVFTVDVYKRFFHPMATEGNLVLAGRVMTMLIGISTIAISIVILLWANSILSVAQEMATYLVLPSSTVFLLGLMTWKTGTKGALSALVSGIIFGWLGKIIALKMGWEGNIVIFFQNGLAVFVTAGLFFAVGTLFPQKGDLAKRAQNFRKRLGQRSVEQLTEVNSSFPAPLRIVGISVVLIAVMLLATLLHPSNFDGTIVIASTGGILLFGGLILCRANKV